MVNFGRWYGFTKEDIRGLVLTDLLSYARGVMIHEELTAIRVTPPMGMKSGDSMRYRNQLKRQLEAIWETMFPKMFGVDAETIQKALAFRERQRQRKAQQAAK